MLLVQGLHFENHRAVPSHTVAQAQVPEEPHSELRSLSLIYFQATRRSLTALDQNPLASPFESLLRPGTGQS